MWGLNQHENTLPVMGNKTKPVDNWGTQYKKTTLLTRTYNDYYEAGNRFWTSVIFPAVGTYMNIFKNACISKKPFLLLHSPYYFNRIRTFQYQLIPIYYRPSRQ
jgi:hypothetical protein